MGFKTRFSYLNLEALALFSFQPPVGLVVSDEQLLLGIPPQLAPQPDGNIDQVARANGTMLADDVRNRCVPRLHTIEKVGRLYEYYYP